MQQSASPSASSTVNTQSPQVSVQGAYSGSTHDPNPMKDSVVLTLADAIRRGLEFNLGKLGVETSSRQAQARQISARSALGPTITAGLSENAAKIDFAVEGFNSSLFGSNLGGFNFPITTQPFHFYDLRGSFQQNVLDLTAIHNYEEAKQTALSAGFDLRQAREEVVFAVTSTYLQLLATNALIEQQRVEVQYAAASYTQARAQADAGNKAPIDANRSQVELQTEQLRLRSQLADLQKQKNALARMIGLPLAVSLQTEEKLEAHASDLPVVDEVLRRALMLRQDLKAAEAQLRAAEEARKAARAERLPSATISGYYGIQGVNPNSGNGVFQASAAINIPIFDGGRTHADIVQADAAITNRRAQLSNQRGTVELEVRNAYIDLSVANDQVLTAEGNRTLALATLQQSQDRFAVGVADSVEVVNSQEALAAADRDYVRSVFAQNIAKVSLAHAMGEAEKDIPEILRGSK